MTHEQTANSQSRSGAIALSDLPSPPPGKSGWPWTEASTPFNPSSPSLSFPKITIVTPSYNQAEFIEETIRSVLLQGYPNLEYIVIDGGSTDGSIDIIRKYEPWLTFWVSEPDRGQSHAINKGFASATGDLLGWINSDDMLAANALQALAEKFEAIGELGWVVGACLIVSAERELIEVREHQSVNLSFTILNWETHNLVQPEVFFTRHLWQLAGPLDETLHYAMDYDLWLAFFQYSDPLLLPTPLGIHREQAKAKTKNVGIKLYQEWLLSIDKRLSKDYKSLRRAAKFDLTRRLVQQANRFCSLSQYSLARQFLWLATRISMASLFLPTLYVALAKLILGREIAEILKLPFRAIAHTKNRLSS